MTIAFEITSVNQNPEGVVFPSIDGYGGSPTLVDIVLHDATFSCSFALMQKNQKIKAVKKMTKNVDAG